MDTVRVGFVWLAVLFPSLAWCATPETSTDTRPIQIAGCLEQWGTVTCTLEGPFADEADEDPNPFTDYNLQMTFQHESGDRITVPGYFAADGNAGETSATAGDRWRAHFTPHKVGHWICSAIMRQGRHAAIDTAAERESAVIGRYKASFQIEPSTAQLPDLAARGRLEYVGKRYLRFAGSGEYFLKVGPDAPETLLAYEDFDGTVANRRDCPLKTWQPHVSDWSDGDPTWQAEKGRGLIGAINYLSSKGLNTVSFLTYNAGGDGDNVWPFVERDAKLHYDCSKLDQWAVVFDHATRRGLHLHFKLQETENDDNRHPKDAAADVPTALDQGQLGPERKLYLRELIARFGHALALNWNLGEENTQSSEEVIAMARYIRAVDPYGSPIVLHTYPNQQDKVYKPLLGNDQVLTGVSLQNSWRQVHRLTTKWIDASLDAGHPWVVANDEQNPAGMGVPVDIGYRGNDGQATEGQQGYDMHDIRKFTLWGNLMAGGAGVEYYFGYQLPENDLRCEDFRSRDQTWNYCRVAKEFFTENDIPFDEMSGADPLVGNLRHDNSHYCFARKGQVYLVYLPQGEPCQLDLEEAEGEFTLGWFDPIEGGPIAETKTSVQGGAAIEIVPPNKDHDWLAVIRSR